MSSIFILKQQYEVIAMNFKPVSDYIESFLRREKGVPCCDLKIMREHQVLFRYQSGFSDYEDKMPLSGNELYYMYSCTKPITCTAAMQLVERGVVALDDPVSQYLPAFHSVFLLQNGEKKTPQKTMTLRHLFTMSAGFDYHLQAAPILETVHANPNADTLTVVNSFIRSPLHFEPGEKFQYSLCHDVLAAVVEAATGVKFSEYLNQNIFAPLGMSHTFFHLPEGMKDLLAAQYECYEPGKIRPHTVPNAFQITPSYESGGAGLLSTVDDYSLFADAMANGGVGSSGAQILKPETIDLMRTEQLSTYTMNPAFSCAAGPGYGYGLGVRTLIDKTDGQRSSLGEFGWDGAAGSYVMIDPTYKLSIFFAMHVREWPTLIGFGHAPIRDLTYDILGL